MLKYVKNMLKYNFVSFYIKNCHHKKIVEKMKMRALWSKMRVQRVFLEKYFGF
jgi:hypothetical protein